MRASWESLEMMQEFVSIADVVSEKRLALAVILRAVDDYILELQREQKECWDMAVQRFSNSKYENSAIDWMEPDGDLVKEHSLEFWCEYLSDKPDILAESIRNFCKRKKEKVEQGHKLTKQDKVRDVRRYTRYAHERS